jgi:hypothetical protein
MPPVLTPRIAAANSWTVYAHCDKCRAMTLLDLKPLLRKYPDRDLGEALVRGKFTGLHWIERVANARGYFEAGDEADAGADCAARGRVIDA